MPIRIEIGPRDVKENAVVLARRDKPGKEGKEFGVSMDGEALRSVILDLQIGSILRTDSFSS